jgi:hypothetical protein
LFAPLLLPLCLLVAPFLLLRLWCKSARRRA